MADIGELPTPGVKPWNLNPALLAMNTELAGVLVAAAKSPDLLITGGVTRNANQAVVSASVRWPDGTVGTFTADALSTSFPGAIDGYHITYGNPVKRTYTQPTVTRNSSGAVTNVPAMLVS